MMADPIAAAGVICEKLLIVSQVSATLLVYCLDWIVVFTQQVVFKLFFTL